MYGSIVKKTWIKHDSTNAQKEIVAAENEIQICPSQLDTFHPYRAETRSKETMFFAYYELAFPQNQR